MAISNNILEKDKITSIIVDNPNIKCSFLLYFVSPFIAPPPPPASQFWENKANMRRGSDMSAADMAAHQKACLR